MKSEAYSRGYRDGTRGREYGDTLDYDWHGGQCDDYEDGFTSGANARAWKPDAREYYRDGTTPRVVG